MQRIRSSLGMLSTVFGRRRATRHGDDAVPCGTSTVTALAKTHPTTQPMEVAINAFL